MGIYKLINPYIVGGNIKTSFKTKSPVSSAHKFWKNMSQKKKFIFGEVLNFFITIQCEETGELFHFKISEINNKNEVEFEISDVTDETKKNISERDVESFKSEIKNLDTAFSDNPKIKTNSNLEKKHIKIIQNNTKKDKLSIYFGYIPYIYNSNSVFVPCFRNIVPYIQIFIKK